MNPETSPEPVRNEFNTIIHHRHYLHLASELTGIVLTEDVTPYEEWLRSVHDKLPGLTGEITRDISIIETEVLGALRPAPPDHPSLPDNFPLCIADEVENAYVPNEARIAYALTGSAWDLTESDPNTADADQIYEGLDGLGNCWAIGISGSGTARKTAFEFVAKISELSCKSTDELVSLWARICRVVGPALPEPELTVRVNSYIDTDDLDQYALDARAQANLAAAADRHGLTWYINREGGHVDLRVEDRESSIIPAIRELIAQGEPPYFVDVEYEEAYQRIHDTYGPKESGGEGLFYEIDVDPY